MEHGASVFATYQQKISPIHLSTIENVQHLMTKRVDQPEDVVTFSSSVHYSHTGGTLGTTGIELNRKKAMRGSK